MPIENTNDLYQQLELSGMDARKIQKELDWALEPTHYIFTPNHSYYPNLLKEINYPPKLLYVLGNPLVLHQPQISMVGSRNPTPTGLEIAFEMARKLSDAGFIITSGLALGIDAASHSGALSAGGKSIAVLGSGLSCIYPFCHTPLAKQISENGAVISEFPLSMKPFPGNFPQRNRIISGLSFGTLVVEASKRSGSLITARLALEQNREVFAIPGSIRNPLSSGCHRLIKQGAKLVESITDIIAELSIMDQRLPSEVHKLDKEEGKLLKCMGFETTSVDQLVARTGFEAPKVTSLLLSIELNGYIKPVSGGFIRVK